MLKKIKDSIIEMRDLEEKDWYNFYNVSRNKKNYGKSQNVEFHARIFNAFFSYSAQVLIFESLRVAEKINRSLGTISIQ